MKTRNREQLLAELRALQQRLEDAEETLRAIRGGEVDGLVIEGPGGPQVYTLKGAETAYRSLVEQVQEGVATVLPDGTILYGNRRFAEMAGAPLETVIGASVLDFIAPKDQPTFQAVIQEGGRSEVDLRTSPNPLSVLLSASHLDIDGSPAISLIVTDLTEQKRYEEIFASEKLSRLILEQSAEIILVCDERGRIIRASARAHRYYPRRLLLQPFDEVTGLYFTKYFHPEKFSIAPILQGGIVRGLEVTTESGKGSVYHFLLGAKPLWEPGGEMLGCVVTMTDITERRKAEQALAEREKRFATVVNHSPDFISRLDLDLRYLFVNKAVTSVTGAEPEDLLGKTVCEVGWPPEACDLFETGCRRAMASGHPGAVEYDIGARHLISRIIPEFGVSELLQSLLVITEDITERKEIEEALKRSRDELEEKVRERTHDLRERVKELRCLYRIAELRDRREGSLADSLQRIVEAAPSGWQFSKVAGSKIEVNGQEYQTEGFEETAWILRSPILLKGERVGSIQVSYSEERPFIDEGPFTKEERVLIEAIAREIGMVLTRCQAEEELHRLNAELEQRVLQRTAQLKAANEELESFSYSVSHDLRAPLLGIDGFSKMLEKRYSDHLDDEGKRLISVIRNSTSRMGQLIDDLLDFSRWGRQEIKLSAIDMVDLTKEVFSQLSSSDQKVSFRVGELPLIRADRSMMRQVLSNLLSNALKFSSSREHPIVEVGGTKGPSENTYYVKDNGVGFDPAYQEKLFLVFSRLHRPEEFSGTGVGLAIVKRIIQEHGGRVWVEGAIDQGATFYFSLPNRKESR